MGTNNKKLSKFFICVYDISWLIFVFGFFWLINSVRLLQWCLAWKIKIWRGRRKMGPLKSEHNNDERMEIREKAKAVRSEWEEGGLSVTSSLLFNQLLFFIIKRGRTPPPKKRKKKTPQNMLRTKRDLNKGSVVSLPHICGFRLLRPAVEFN